MAGFGPGQGGVQTALALGKFKHLLAPTQRGQGLALAQRHIARAGIDPKALLTDLLLRFELGFKHIALLLQPATLAAGRLGKHLVRGHSFHPLRRGWGSADRLSLLVHD